MNVREIMKKTLSGEKRDRNAYVETFFPWEKTMKRWIDEGLPKKYYFDLINFETDYFKINTLNTQAIYNYEKYMGFDGLKRVNIGLPFYFWPEGKVLEENNILKFEKKVLEIIKDNYTQEITEQNFSRYNDQDNNGEYSIRLRLDGFFWTPRIIMGIEKHLYAFYDHPKIMHKINKMLLDFYFSYLEKVFHYFIPDVITISEDLSGKNGPMISKTHYKEFLSPYYVKLFRYLKDKGVKNIMVDTDGDFLETIPLFLDDGVDGFIPMDVNAGMDIRKVREAYPNIKIIGGFNKLLIEKGKNEIDKEFIRLKPVIEKGKINIGCDHQVTYNTRFEDYKYYIKKLKKET